MDEKIDPDLFARLMQLSPATRKDLLEFIGQGTVSAEDALRAAIQAGRLDQVSVPKRD